MTVLCLISLILIRLHTKWRTLWFCTRLILICLLVVPLILTFQTAQFHILLSTITITLVYAFLTFTLIQSLIISLTISILHIVLTFNEEKNFSWINIELISLIFYHFILNLAGIFVYVQIIKHIREHFHAYEVNLYEKNQFNVDCKKLNIIMAHCQQRQFPLGCLSKLANGFNASSLNNVHRSRGTVINCSLSLNEQTRLHTCDELATLFDVLFCQIEQLILKQQPHVRFTFDNETIIIVLLDENENHHHPHHQIENIDICCRLAIEVLRFIQHVNNVTQWNITSIIGIDYEQLNIISTQFIHGSAYEYARWLREECGIANRIHVSSRIYDALKTNKFYEFHSYAWTTNNNNTTTTTTTTNNNNNTNRATGESALNPLTYFLFSTNMYEPLTSLSTSTNTSGMIDQLTRIQAQYHVEKHLGTITLTRSLRKRSLMELTSKHLHWFTLNFKQQSYSNDFQSNHRSNHPHCFLFIFTIIILLASLCQSFVLGHVTWYYIILFPIAILGLLFLIIIFLYSIRLDRSSYTKIDNSKINKKFSVYLNILICLTLSTLFIVAIQYHSVHNFKYLFTFLSPMNRTTMLMNNMSSSQMNSTIVISDSSSPFDRRYHDYLSLSTIYPLYFCCLFRPCSWLIKLMFIFTCLTVQLCLFEYVWLSTNDYFHSILSLYHYTTFTLIILHGFLLILLSYVREWLEKLDFIWLKQVSDERTMIIHQRHDLIQQTTVLLPYRTIEYYLRTDVDRTLAQHYHLKYDRMGLLYIRFSSMDNNHKSEEEIILIDLLNDLHYRIRNSDEKYSNITMNLKSSAYEVLFSIDTNNLTNNNDPIKCVQQLVELLFEIDERLKMISSSSSIRLAACLHIGCVHEILIHLEKYPKTDMWSDHIALVQLLISKTQLNHCLTTATVYHLLNDLYLFRTAGSIVSTQMNTANNTNIYYLLGRLIGDNVFQGRNALPLTIGHGTMGTVQKSSSTDDSHRSHSSQSRCKLDSQTGQNQIQTSTTTTTSSSGAVNEQQSLIKQSSRKYVRISNGNHLGIASTIENPSYRRTLLQALNGTTPPTSDNHQQQQQPSPAKKFCARLTTKKQTPPPRDSFVPRMVHMSDNSCWSSRELMSTSENSGSKCLILTQKMLNGSMDDTRCKSTPPPPFRHASSERKSFTEEDFRQLLHHGGQSSKELMPVSRSLSITNEETASSFSGWDDIPASPLPSIKSAIVTHIQRKESVKHTPPSPPIVDCYYPRRPCDLSFTVNMSTTEDESSSRTDTKSTVIASPTSTVATLTSPLQKSVPSIKSPPPPSTPAPTHQPVPRYRPVPFNLARKLIAETSESALSELSIDNHPEPWTQNSAYQSKHPHRSRLSSSYSNLLDLIQQRQDQSHDSSKYLFSKQIPSYSSTIHSDLLQRWLDDQLNLFRHQINQNSPPPPSTKKPHRFSTVGVFGEDSDDDESDTVSENTFTVLTNKPNQQQPSAGAVPIKRPYNHVRYKPLRKTSTAAAAHLIRHESLKHRNKPLLFRPTSPLNSHHQSTSNNNNNNNNNSLPKGIKPTRTDTSSMPRSDLSDLSSSRPDNLSESVISNLESEYDNIYTQPITANTTTTLMSNSQILSDDEDEPTITSRCYF